MPRRTASIGANVKVGHRTGVPGALNFSISSVPQYLVVPLVPGRDIVERGDAERVEGGGKPRGERLRWLRARHPTRAVVAGSQKDARDRRETQSVAGVRGRGTNSGFRSRTTPCATIRAIASSSASRFSGARSMRARS